MFESESSPIPPLPPKTRSSFQTHQPAILKTSQPKQSHNNNNNNNNSSTKAPPPSEVTFKSEVPKSDVVPKSDPVSQKSEMVIPKVNSDVDLDRPMAKPGTIADREHRKWTENAIPLQNNPYSRENIERRLRKNSDSQGNYVAG